MTENNSQSLMNIQHERLHILEEENHRLRLKISHDRQRKLIRKKEYEEKFEHLQELIHDAGVRLNEGSELIRKMQQHLKISQEKLSEKSKALVAKEEILHQYQTHIANLNQMIRQLIDEKKELIDAYKIQQLNMEDNQKLDVAIQTSPTRRCVRFNLDKENYPIDSKYFPST